MEKKILKAALTNRGIFDQLEKLEVQHKLSDSGQIIYEHIRTYYENDIETSQCDLDIVRDRIIRRHPRQQNVFEGIFGILQEIDISALNILQEVVALEERRIGTSLARALLEESAEIPKLIEEYQSVKQNIEETLNDDTSEVYNSVPIEDLFTDDKRVRKIILLPHSLNDRIGGGIEAGDNILIYARPEIGKSLVAINAACGFLAQGYKVLYYGNEDPAQRMVRRFVSRLSGMDKQSCIQQPNIASRLSLERGYSNLYFVKGQRNTFSEVRHQLERIKPDILILDQLRHMETGNDNRVQQLEEAAIAARKIASEYHIPVISVTQAGDSADGRLVLGQGDVDYSNTGIPGAMDLMVGVGANDEYLNRQMRRISLPKNKLNNDHSSFDIVVNEALSKIVE